ncbi:MAG TPA: acetyl-CoA hydrolase/transferase C-terminal domain-containing protein [Caulobacteraceae bacterium]|nr:acetyl-CoA hydrolase/transferase C-terminal domain-containing protein [Caulobacteraceae bacterium]
MSPAELESIFDAFQPGASIFIPGGTGEPLALRRILADHPDRAAGVRFIGCLLPGINDFDYASLHPEARLTLFLFPPAFRTSFEAGRVRVLPMPYSQTAEYLAETAQVDTAILQVGPPDADGMCSFGVCADFPPLVWRRARRRIGLINPDLPQPARAAKIPFSALDVAIEASAPVIEAADAPVSDEVAAITTRIAALIPDGAVVQTGIGGAPGAIYEALTSHRNLTIRSGMITPGFRALAGSGALAADGHITGLALGTSDFYRFLAENDVIAFADARVTHGAASLTGIERFISIGSALEVDLFGQVNLEWRSGRMVSGVGGAPDFIRAAANSRGGRAIIALPASAGGGKISRIVPRLSSPTASISRTDIDTVVTEFGVAALRGLSLDERAEALIAIADPRHQTELEATWLKERRLL